MIESAFVVAAACGWAFRKAKRVAGRADAEVDRVLDGLMDRLHDVVTRALGANPALERLQKEASEGLDEPTQLTRQLVELSLTAAIEDNPQLGKELEEAVADLKQASEGTSVQAGDGSVAAGGDVQIKADNGSIAGGVLTFNQGVSLGTPQKPSPENR